MSMTLRLLSAAAHTYAVRSDGPVAWGAGAAAPDPGFIQWLPGSPMGFAAGSGDFDAGLVGRIREGVVVALRGTIFGGTPRDVLQDWINDGDIPLAAKPGFPGLVHSGFHRSFLAVWPDLSRELRAQVEQADREAGRPVTLFVTGHSKGGALASLAAWRLRKDYPTRAIVVRTFASPRMSDVVFKAAYEGAIKDHVRYECDGDLVPDLPLTDAMLHAFGMPAWLLDVLRGNRNGYVSVGPLGYIRADGSIVPDNEALAAVRRAALLRLLAAGDYTTIAASHGIGRASRYCGARYPL